MSLINEALQRAREEAAARLEAEDLPGTYLTAPRHMPPRAVWRRNLAIGVVASMTVAVAVWLWLGRSVPNGEPPAVASLEVAESLSQPQPQSQLQPVDDRRLDSPATESSARVETLPSAPSDAPSAEDSSGSPSATGSALAAAGESSPQPATTAPRERPSDPPRVEVADSRPSAFDDIPFVEPDLGDESSAARALNGRVFIREVDLPGYGSVELSGIAGSVAVLGGRIVSRGERVGGFELAEIETDGVVFSGRGATFRLKLR